MKLKRFRIDITELNDGMFKANILGSSDPRVMEVSDIDKVEEIDAIKMKFNKDGIKEIEIKAEEQRCPAFTISKYSFKNESLENLLEDVKGSVIFYNTNDIQH